MPIKSPKLGVRRRGALIPFVILRVNFIIQFSSEAEHSNLHFGKKTENHGDSN